MSHLHHIFKEIKNNNTVPEHIQEENDLFKTHINFTDISLPIERSNLLNDLNTGNNQNNEESYFNPNIEIINGQGAVPSEESIKSILKEENHQNQVPEFKKDERDNKSILNDCEISDVDFFNGIDSFANENQSKIELDIFGENEEEDSNMDSFIKILDGVNKESKFSMFKENNNTYLFGQSTMDK